MNELNSSAPTWNSFLKTQGACFSSENTHQLLGFNSTSPQYPAPASFVAPLIGLGLISLSGEDAIHFLHNQITNDVEKLDADTVRLAGYCSPKGRLLASFLYWKHDDTITLELPNTILAAIQKRLQMFVLRAKVKLSDVTDHYAILGLVGNTAEGILSDWFPAPPLQTYTKVTNQYGTLLRLTDIANIPRYQWIAPQEVAITAWPSLIRQLPPVGEHAWHLTEINAGIPQITAATQEQFVPQMINFDLIDGINFKKGCYPGQEIVARSQYLGKIKRRVVLASVDATDIKAGTEVFSSDDPQQPCGMVVNAEQNDINQSACLVELKLAATTSGTIHLGNIDGPQLDIRPLPYILADPQ